MMRAVLAQNSKPVIVDIPTPEPRPDELLIRVRATALNRADLLQVRGLYPPPPGSPDTLGLELAGEVVTVGGDVRSFRPGDRVMALVGGGGYAEYAAVPAGHCIPVPATLTDAQAAAVPEAFLTAYSNLIEFGGMSSADKVLIHAGASGVGLAGIQIARIAASKVAVTASAAKHALCKENGAHLTIDYKTENFAEIICAQWAGVDLIMDMVGAPYWDDNVRVLNPYGRIVLVGTQGGSVKEVNFGDIMRKRLKVMGSTLRSRTYDEKSQLIANFWQWAAPHFQESRLKPVVWRTLPLEQVEEALRLMSENANAGKIVLVID
ncbi:MAG: NAD(P)H-quinone oxidoreductase [Anaerolineae bacterium]